MEAYENKPLAEYTRRLERCRMEIAAEEGRHIRLGNLRLLILLAGALLIWLVVWREAISGWWILGPVAAFIVVAVIHDRGLQAKARAQRAAAFYERGLERLRNSWMGKGEKGERFLDRTHPYAEDLDIFGAGSVFELLCAARTRMGEQALASWLLAPAPISEIHARHEAVSELRERLDLREDLAVLGESVRAGVHPDELAHWSESPPLLGNGVRRILALVLPLLTVAATVFWAVTGLLSPLALAATAQFVFVWRLRARVQKIVANVDQPAHDLALLSQVLERFEREEFRAPLLTRLRAQIETEGKPASGLIARLGRLMELLDSRDNLAVRVIDPIVLWTIQLTFAIESWRKAHGASVRKWLDAVGEIEALSSLAAYSYEHPDDPFPELLDSKVPVFNADSLTHPLLEDHAVSNDVRIDASTPLLIVSGSNMSGKSTLLRSVGVNVVLAMSGAPVRAKRLELSLLAVGASIRITDSIQTGISRFYAEIKRIRMIVDLAGRDLPLLFLLDELLHGTNSHDRAIGAEAIVRTLVSRGAIGLVTTHDLALARISDSLNPPALNVHFEDQFVDGHMSFDYRLRTGVVNKSNALELMRSVGLEV